MTDSIERFEVELKSTAVYIVAERNPKNSTVCIEWYNKDDKGKYQLVKRNCGERMTEKEFRLFRNQMKAFNPKGI